MDDERVCDILAVSRAFGDADFKAPGVQRLAKKGVEWAPCSGHMLRAWDVGAWMQEQGSEGAGLHDLHGSVESPLKAVMHM